MSLPSSEPAASPAPEGGGASPDAAARSDPAKLSQALPFWLSLGTLPLAALGLSQGGIWVFALPAWCWLLFSAVDAMIGLNKASADPETDEADLGLYRLLTLIWVPLQLLMLCFVIWYLPRATHLDLWEKIALVFGTGVTTGTIGINYAHELMHQKPKSERRAADLLLASVLYSHFRSEHLRVHHLWVGTPRDAVSARYNEGFHRFFPRVLIQIRRSAFLAEKAMLHRRGLPWWHHSNPYWLYWGLQGGFLLLALALGGEEGLAIFLGQAFVAVWQLELVNYVEHYGLTRRYLGEGRYEHTLPRHSWNASHKGTNWLLINLQRHSDHHYKPDRRFPLLQTYQEDEAPQLPHGYPVMATMALCPPLWRRVMNPKVRAWRRRFYPDITDWHPYNKALNPLPKGSA